MKIYKEKKIIEYASCLEERIIFYENRMKESDTDDSET